MPKFSATGERKVSLEGHEARQLLRAVLGVLLSLTCLTLSPTYGDTLDQPFSLTNEATSWDDVFQELSQRLPVIAAVPSNAAPILPKGKLTLRNFLEELSAQNATGWSVQSADKEQTVLVLNRPCPESRDISTYVPEQNSLIGDETYALLRFIDSLPPQQLQSLSVGPTAAEELPKAARQQLSNSFAYLSASQQRYLLQKQQSQGTPVEQRLIGIRLIPMVEVTAQIPSPRFSLLPWTAFAYKDVQKTQGELLRWSGQTRKPLPNNISVELPLAPLLLNSALTDKSVVTIEKSGWRPLQEVLAAVPNGKSKDVDRDSDAKFVINQALGDLRVWTTAGAYSRGDIRQFALRALCVAVRPLEKSDTDTLIVDNLRPSVVEEDSQLRARRLQILRKLSPLLLSSQTESLPFPSGNLWVEKRAFSEFTPQQQSMIAERWLESVRVYRTMKELPLRDLESLTPEMAVELLKKENAQVSIQPGALFTGGLYESQKDAPDVLSCIWEVQLLL